MQQRMKVTWKGETFEVRAQAGLGDMIAFERQFGVPATVFDEANDAEVKMEWVAFLAFRAARKGGHIDKTIAFDDWVDDLDLIELPDTGAEEVDASPEDQPGMGPAPQHILPPPLPSALASTLESS
jgi:hypothetical protein